MGRLRVAKVELYPSKYIKRHYWDEQTYLNEPLPEGARVVVRYFKGAFVIFKKTSIYNQISETYDGRHEKLGADEFKNQIIYAYEHLKISKLLE